MRGPQLLALSVITLIAATINGALGYGFSSLTVPMALLMFSNRVLNPALVLIEVVLNGYVLFVNRRSLPAVWRRMLPIIAGLAPGIALGTSLVASVNPSWMKLWTFACLIPLILVQVAVPVLDLKLESAWVGLLFGSGVGTLYAVTTISGPPLALDAQQPGIRQAGLPCGAQPRAARRVDHDGGGVSLRRLVHGDERSAVVPDPAEPGGWPSRWGRLSPCPGCSRRSSAGSV